jgi:hypothetical protein
LAGNIADFPTQLVKAHSARCQGFQDQQAPLVTNSIQYIPDGAGLLKFFLYGAGSQCGCAC